MFLSPITDREIQHGGQDVTLPKPEFGTKRPKPTIRKNDAFAMVISAEQ